MATRRPWVKWHIVDYRNDTQHLTTLQHGIYRLLLDEYWIKGGLPCDDRTLAVIAKVDLKTWDANRPIIAAFFTRDWRHKRMDRDLSECAAISAKRAEVGRKGVTSRRSQRKQLHNQLHDQLDNQTVNTLYTLHSNREDSLSPPGPNGAPSSSGSVASDPGDERSEVVPFPKQGRA